MYYLKYCYNSIFNKHMEYIFSCCLEKHFKENSFMFSKNVLKSEFFSTNCGFTSEEKRICIERLKQIKTQKFQSSSKSLQNAAVLIPLCYVNGEISLLYTLRRQDLKRHRGQVSFPGGKQDSKDLDLAKTALRETEEELGILQSSIDVWGNGNTVTGRKFNILPVVGFVGEIDVENLKPNHSEVEFAFTMPLKHFFCAENCKYTQYRNGKGYVLPVYINGRCRIWGITALITHIFLRALYPNKYIHELHLIKPVYSDSNTILNQRIS